MTTATLDISNTGAMERVATQQSRHQLLRLYLSEMRLFLRESQVLVFVIGFPIITVLVLGGVFGTEANDSGFEWVNPSHFYVAAYFGVVLAAIGLIMLPAHVASYRERGVIRRFDTSGFPSWVFPAVQFMSGVTFALIGFASLVVTALLSSGMPEMHDPVGTLVGLAAGTLAFISIGVALGMYLPSARAAQGIGLTLFFPMFLLAGAGPPPEALSGTMRTISDWLPLTHVIRVSQEPWLNIGDGSPHLSIVLGMLGVSAVLWLLRSAQVSRVA